MEELLVLLEPLLMAFSGKYGVIPQGLAYILSARAAAKSVEKLIDTVVKFTKSDSDNKWWAKTQSKKWYKTLSVVLDWSTTIKLPQ